MRSSSRRGRNEEGAGMTVDRERLVELITQRVMEELQRPEGRPAPPAPRAASPAPAAIAHSGEHDAATCERCQMFGVNTARGPEDTRALHAAGASRVVTTIGYCPA